MAAPGGNLRTVGGFPDAARVTLRYTQKNTITSTTGALVSYDFRGNSVFDPDFTGTGAQPAGFDDFALNYNRYRVMGSKISASITTIATGGLTIDVAMFPYNAQVSVATIVDAVAQPYSKYASVGINYPAILQTDMTSAKILGRPHSAVLGSDACQSLCSTNPSDVWFWAFRFATVDSATTSVSYVTFVIDYDVIFFDRDPGDLDTKIARALDMKKTLADRHKSRSLEQKESLREGEDWTLTGECLRDACKCAPAPEKVKVESSPSTLASGKVVVSSRKL